MKHKNLFSLFLVQLLIQVIFVFTEHFVSSQTACGAGFVGLNGVCDECGLTFFTPNVRRRREAVKNDTLNEKSTNGNKIVGGIDATANSWPAQALLYTSDVNGNQFLCGGTLIRRNVILTAAHCLETDNPRDFEVYLGVQDSSNLRSSGVVRARVRKVIAHPNYNTDNMHNDIALLILTQPVRLTRRIQLACLPPALTSFPLANSDSWIIGWGTTGISDEPSDILQNVKIRVLNPTTACKGYDGMNWTSQVCAGNVNGGQDTCQGDSGGPLYVRGTIGGKTKYIHAGITSYGIGCARKNYPGIYIRTSAFISWINENSNQNSRNQG